MEIDTINQVIYEGLKHGLWIELLYCESIDRFVPYKGHYFMGKNVGYVEGDKLGSIYYFRAHATIDNQGIGCARFANTQYYHNKPGNKFGEEIKWK